MSTEITAGPVRQELASAIRAVNAALAQIGSSHQPDLRHHWLSLDRALNLAILAGDDEACRVAVKAYRRNALAEIARAA